MSDPADPGRLLSHAAAPPAIEELIRHKIEQINRVGDLAHVTARRQVEILQQLGDCEFGRFLLQNQGVNGYWTHYMLTHPWHKDRALANATEQFLLERAPTILATQERFTIFLKENQAMVGNDRELACIPSGMMGELLYLDFTGIARVQLIGIDYDQSALGHAATLATQKHLQQFSRLKQADAWQMDEHNAFDLISSNGLNIYEPDHDRVLALYRQFYTALKRDGKLVTSFVTPPPGLSDHCEWTMSAIDPEDALLQKIIFSDILRAKWQCYRSTQQTRLQLEQAGFQDIRFLPDRANIFPTVIAFKRGD